MHRAAPALQNWERYRQLETDGVLTQLFPDGDPEEGIRISLYNFKGIERVGELGELSEEQLAKLVEVLKSFGVFTNVQKLDDIIGRTQEDIERAHPDLIEVPLKVSEGQGDVSKMATEQQSGKQAVTADGLGSCKRVRDFSTVSFKRTMEEGEALQKTDMAGPSTDDVGPSSVGPSTS